MFKQHFGWKYWENWLFWARFSYWKTLAKWRDFCRTRLVLKRKYLEVGIEFRHSVKSVDFILKNTFTQYPLVFWKLDHHTPYLQSYAKKLTKVEISFFFSNWSFSKCLYWGTMRYTWLESQYLLVFKYV